MRSVCGVSPRASVWVLFPTMQKPQSCTIHWSDWLDCSRRHWGCFAKQSPDRPRDTRSWQHVLWADVSRSQDGSPPPGKVPWPRRPWWPQNLAKDWLLWPGLGTILQHWLRIYEAEKTVSREELGHWFWYWKLSNNLINLRSDTFFITSQCSCLLLECLWVRVFAAFWDFLSSVRDAEETFLSPCTGQWSPVDWFTDYFSVVNKYSEHPPWVFSGTILAPCLSSLCRYQALRPETRERLSRTGASSRPSTDQQRNSGLTNLSRTWRKKI